MPRRSSKHAPSPVSTGVVVVGLFVLVLGGPLFGGILNDSAAREQRAKATEEEARKASEQAAKSARNARLRPILERLNRTQPKTVGEASVVIGSAPVECRRRVKVNYYQCTAVWPDDLEIGAVDSCESAQAIAFQKYDLADYP